MSEMKSTSRVKNKSRFKKLAKILVTVFIAVVVFLVFYSSTVIGKAPKINTGNIYSYLPESSRLYDDKGKQIDSVFVDGGNRISIPYSEMPKNLINAIIAIEDRTFWDHHGFNVLRIFGAIRDSITSGGSISGTSTITQQLARNVYLSETKSVRSLNRKVAEAWYTVLLERNLSKKQIVEAYLNTIYFGHNTYGVESAAKAYFNKSAKDLDLIECAALASIPKAPDNYALVRSIDNNTDAGEAIDLSKNTVLKKNPDFTAVYNGDISKGRRNTTLKYMNEQGFINKAEYDAATNDDLLKHMDLSANNSSTDSVYFNEFVVKQVIADLISEGYTEANARKLVYTGGLKIYTTQDSKAQTAIEKAFSDSGNFPGVSYKNTPTDRDGNILSKEGKLLLYSYKSYLSGGVFTFRNGELSVDNNGNIILHGNQRLNFYKTVVKGKTDYSVEFKPMYIKENGFFYSIDGGTLTIPPKYKTLDKNGNLIISAKFVKDYPKYFTVSGSTYSISENGYTLRQKVKQPQSSMVICDNYTGAVKAMVGGRDTEGKLLYNRATSPRQPGSSIKPLGVYAPALQQGADAAAEKKPMSFHNFDKNQKSEGYGKYWTAASKINDAELIVNGKVWPRNIYNGYKGIMSLRASVEQSVNVNAVRVFQQVGSKYSEEMLKKFGVTSVVTDGATNDMNAAALALGGMTKGISPLEMSSAYTTFPNKGVHNSYTCYTEVKNSKGKVILKGKSKPTKVLSTGVAFIMQDILRTTVSHGSASPANTRNQVTAGKTGTTSDNYDAWFCGFTPQYSAALWIGNDLNIELTEGSAAAAKLWGKIMNQATSGMSGSLPETPSDVINVNGEYFVKGTEIGVSTLGEIKKIEVEVCKESGYKATPWSTDRVKVELDPEDPHAKYYCPINNRDPVTYPVAPGQEHLLPANPTPVETPAPPAGNNSNNNGIRNRPAGPVPTASHISAVAAVLLSHHHTGSH